MTDSRDEGNDAMMSEATRKKLAKKLGVNLSETSGGQFIQARPAPDSSRPFVDLPAADPDEKADS